MLRSRAIVPVLSVGLVMPAAAQQVSEQEARKAAECILNAYASAEEKHDWAGLAALYTEDGILITPFGPSLGRAAIEKTFALLDNKDWTPNPPTLDQVKVIGNEAILRTGSWSGTMQGPDGPAAMKGFWATTDIRDGGIWKIRMESFSITPAPPPELKKYTPAPRLRLACLQRSAVGIYPSGCNQSRVAAFRPACPLCGADRL